MNSKKEIDARILELREDYAARAEARKELERAWIINLNYYNGNQYAECLPTGALVKTAKKYPWQYTSVYNHIAPIVESRLAKFNRMNTSVSCVPASYSPEDELAAKLATKLLQGVKEENCFRALAGEAAYWAEICGTAFYKIVWDRSKGRLLNADGLREGDASITVCPPQEIYPDSLSARDICDCRSIIHAKAYPVKVVNDAWGVNIETDGTGAMVMTSETGRDGANALCGKEKDGYVLVIERYSLPNAEHPNGRLLIASGDKVLYDGALPYETESGGRRGLPFVRQVAIPAPSSFFGTGIVERMIPIQRAYNDIKNRKHEFIERMTAGVLVAEDGSVDLEELEDEGIAPGKVIVYRQGSDKPQMLSFGEIPSAFGEEEDRLLNEFVSVSGVSDFLATGSYRGMSNYSGTAISLITEQSNSRLCVTTESIRNAQKAVAVKILRLYKQFATDERLANAENGAYGESAAFKASDISSDDIVFNLDDGQIGSIGDKRELAKDIFAMKLLTDKDGNLGGDSKRKILELLGCEGLSGIRNTDELHRAKADRENETAQRARPTVSEFDDHKVHIEEHTAYMLGFSATEREKSILSEHVAEHRELLGKAD